MLITIIHPHSETYAFYSRNSLRQSFPSNPFNWSDILYSVSSAGLISYTVCLQLVWHLIFSVRSWFYILYWVSSAGLRSSTQSPELVWHLLSTSPTQFFWVTWPFQQYPLNFSEANYSVLLVNITYLLAVHSASPMSYIPLSCYDTLHCVHSGNLRLTTQFSWNRQPSSFTWSDFYSLHSFNDSIHLTSAIRNQFHSTVCTYPLCKPSVSYCIIIIISIMSINETIWFITAYQLRTVLYLMVREIYNNCQIVKALAIIFISLKERYNYCGICAASSRESLTTVWGSWEIQISSVGEQLQRGFDRQVIRWEKVWKLLYGDFV